MQNVYESPNMELVTFEAAEDIMLSSIGPIDKDPSSHERDNEIDGNTWD